MPPKRKFLTLVERVKVIELNNKSRRARKIAEDFGVGKTQVTKYMYIFLILNEYNLLIQNAHDDNCQNNVLLFLALPLFVVL